MKAQRLRFALDQNFPPFVLDAAAHLPDVDLQAISRIDPRAGELGDRELLIYLRQKGWHGLITNNYKMLWVPSEIAAVVKAKIALFAIQGLGDDPLRATGALMIHLPAVVKRVQLGQGQVFRVNPQTPQPEPAWRYFSGSAERRGKSPDELYASVKVTDEELATPVLD